MTCPQPRQPRWPQIRGPNLDKLSALARRATIPEQLSLLGSGHCHTQGSAQMFSSDVPRSFLLVLPRALFSSSAPTPLSVLRTGLHGRSLHESPRSLSSLGMPSSRKQGHFKPELGRSSTSPPQALPALRTPHPNIPSTLFKKT